MDDLANNFTGSIWNRLLNYVDLLLISNRTLPKGLCWVFISVLVFTIDGVWCCAANNRYRYWLVAVAALTVREIIWEEKLKSGPIIVPANVMCASVQSGWRHAGHSPLSCCGHCWLRGRGTGTGLYHSIIIPSINKVNSVNMKSRCLVKRRFHDWLPI